MSNVLHSHLVRRVQKVDTNFLNISIQSPSRSSSFALVSRPKPPTRVLLNMLAPTKTNTNPRPFSSVLSTISGCCVCSHSFRIIISPHHTNPIAGNRKRMHGDGRFTIRYEVSRTAEHAASHREESNPRKSEVGVATKAAYCIGGWRC